MSNKDEKEICENCKHFSQEEAQCKKNAPRGEGRPWPSVKKTDWCSEFKGKDEGPGQVGKDVLKRGVMSNK